MDSCFYEMAERLGIEGAVRRAVNAGQDQKAIEDFVFGSHAYPVVSGI